MLLSMIYYIYNMCMYIRKSSSTRNGKTYTTAQIVEGYRNEKGNNLQHILFNLGSVDKLHQIHVIDWKKGHSKYKALTAVTCGTTGDIQ